MQRKDHALFDVCDDERRSAFEGDTLIDLSNETVRDTSRSQRLVDVITCFFVMVRAKVDDEEGWWVLTHGLLSSCDHVLPPSMHRALLQAHLWYYIYRRVFPFA